MADGTRRGPGSAARLAMQAGSPDHLGAVLDDDGANIAVFSENATMI